MFFLTDCSISRCPQRLRGVFAMAFAIVLAFMFTGTLQAADGGRITDDPQGRTRIPFAEPDAPETNNADMNWTYDQEEDARAEALLALKQTEGTSPVLVIPAAGFTADGASPDSLFFPFGGGYFQGDSTNYGCMVAPAYLPQGAVVEDMFATVYDDDGTFEITVNLRRTDNFNGGTDDMAVVSTGGQSTNVQTLVDPIIDFPTVVYPDYSYFVTTCVQSGSIRLYSVQLYYQ